MSDPYAGPHQPYPGYGQPYPIPAAPYLSPPPIRPPYQSTRVIALVGIGLMAVTVIVSILQSVLMWRSYPQVKRLIYGLLSEDEIDSAARSVSGTGPLLDLAGLLVLAAGVLFLVWLTRARENTIALTPYGLSPWRHRRAQGWVIGSWICPIVQFWYPLNVVQDVVRASEPADRPGAGNSGPTRGLLYGWWVAWTGFWVIVVGGTGAALLSFFIWIVRLVDRVDTADATGDYVDIYDLQDFMVRVALFANIGSTVATALLLLSGVAIAILMLRVARWQDSRFAALMAAGPPPPPQYAPRPVDQRSFPTYGQPPPGSQWPSG